MIRRSTLPAAAVLAAVVAGLGAFALDRTDRGELLSIGVLVGMWGLVEAIARSREGWVLHGAEATRRLMETGVVFAAAVYALNNVFEIAWRSGWWPGFDASVLRDMLMDMKALLVGGFMAYFGDRLAKLPSPWRVRDEPFDWHRVHRFTGRVWTAAGVGVIGMTIVAGPDAARVLVPRILWATILISVARKLTSVALYSVGRGAASHG